VGDDMKNLLAKISCLISFFAIISIASACKTPIVYNSYGVPVSLFGGGTLEINYADYPSGTNMVDYQLTVKNTNDQGLTFVLTPSTTLLNVVFGNSIQLNANEIKNITISVNIGGRNKVGEIYVTGNCDDQTPISEGSIWVSVLGRGDAPANCGNSKTSCGMPGNCQDLSKLDGCYDGYKRTYYCSANQPKYSTSGCAQSNCCSLIGGTCKSNVCSVTQSLKSINLKLTNGHSVSRNALVTMYEPGTTKVINSTNVSGTATLYSPNATVDFQFEYDSRLAILLRNLNLTKATGTSEIVLDTVTTQLPNATFLKAYKISVPSTFTFNGMRLRMKYNGLSFINEQGIAIYRCGSFNEATNACSENWIKQSATKDTVNDIATVELTSFSVYALGESHDITTTTTTTATTSPTTTVSSGGGGGGGSRTTTSTRTTSTVQTTIAISCTCESWTNSGCGQTPCTSDQMKQTRLCDPSACDSESRCTADSSCITEETTTIKAEENTNQPTGMFFGIPTDTAKYAIPIASIAIVSMGIVFWKFNDKIKSFIPTRSSKGYVFTSKHQNPDFVELKVREEPKLVNTTVELKKQQATEARSRAIEDMRKRAHEMDKK
jgi:hypothetical protein